MKALKNKFNRLTVLQMTFVVFAVTVLIALLFSWAILTFASGEATYLLFMVMGWFAGGTIVGFYTYWKGRGLK